MLGKDYVGFASVRIDTGITAHFGTGKYTSTYSAEAMTTAETLDSIKDIDAQNFSIFSDSRSVLEALANLLRFGRNSHLIFL